MKVHTLNHLVYAKRLSKSTSSLSDIIGIYDNLKGFGANGTFFI